MSTLYQPFQPTLTAGGLHRFGMSLQLADSSAPLRNVVHSYLQISVDKPTPYPVMPDATQAIYISTEGSFIAGAYNQSFEFPLLERGEYFGIWFYPGALRKLFELDLQEITNQFADTGFLPCTQFATLHDRIYQQTQFSQRVKQCDQWVLSHLREMPTDRFDQALALIYKARGTLKVEQLANQIGWSRRHLNRMFRSNTGLSTQAFCQTIRRQHACLDLYRTPTNSLNTAIELGYYDQAHLLNDYKKHLQASPGSIANRFMSDFYNP